MQTLRVVDPSFLETAPVRQTLVQTIPASSEETFRCLEDGDSWAGWIPDVEALMWTTPKPFGVGTTRTVTMKQGQLDEEILVWEEGRRMALYWVRGWVPRAVKAFAEDYVLVPNGKDECELRFSWALGGGVQARIFGMVYGRSARKWMRDLEQYLRANRDMYA